MSFYKETLEKAAARATKEFGRPITTQLLKAKTKARSHTEPRYFVMAYMHATGRYSQPQIAKALGLEDHSTVLHGLRRAHGHDGKFLTGPKQIKPLWKKEQFENMVFLDGTGAKLPPQPYEKVNAEQIRSIGLANLARYRGAA